MREREAKREQVEQLVTETVATALRENACIKVIEETQEEGQRVAREQREGVEMMAGRVSSRRKQISSDITSASLSDMQKSIVEAYTNENSDVVVSFDDAQVKNALYEWSRVASRNVVSSIACSVTMA